MNKPHGLQRKTGTASARAVTATVFSFTAPVFHTQPGIVFTDTWILPGHKAQPTGSILVHLIQPSLRTRQVIKLQK